eukprot:04794.XXX_174916_175636_1 [CDS] Oithona nana genome sequencing.
MSADQYIVTVFSFKKPYPKMATGGGSHSSDMDSSFSSLSNQYGPPLDYSFRNISSLEKLERNRPPRQSLRKNRRSPSGRYNSNVIRLANNNLVDTTGLYKMALDVVEFPEDIAWLDLSFNDITSISDDILEFPALKMIYLHGNKIRRFADIQKLQQLPNLYSLTLHGNPIENYPNYRSSIICMFPQLKSLDFAKVTEAEKDKAKLHIIVNNSSVKKYSV